MLAPATTTKPPIPPDLPVPFPETPWKVTDVVFSNLITQGPYKQCKLRPSDPESVLVLRYFLANKPTNRSIKSAYCVHNPNLSEVFQHAIPSMEEDAKKPIFSPKWKEKTTDPHYAARKKALDRFEKMSAPFGHITITQGVNNR